MLRLCYIQGVAILMLSSG